MVFARSRKANNCTVSETIAKAMVVFDDQSNNFRNLILPLAATHNLVRNAVLAASAHQLASKKSEFAMEALKYQTIAVNSLTQCPDMVRSETAVVLAAVTIILVNEIVSGGSEQFRILYAMMQHCMKIEEAASINQPSSLISFLREQVRTCVSRAVILFSDPKLIGSCSLGFCIQPFLGEETAIWSLSSRFLGPLEFLTRAASQHPKHMDTIETLGKLSSWHQKFIYTGQCTTYQEQRPFLLSKS